MVSNPDHVTLAEGEVAPSFASSLPVLNVQETVRDDPLLVPERYLRNKEDVPKIADTCHDIASEIPIIDFSLLLKQHKEELNKLDMACKEWGFFQGTRKSLANRTWHANNGDLGILSAGNEGCYGEIH